MNKVEQWKQEKHGFDVWPDVLRYAEAKTPMKEIDTADLERMKWYGAFYRKRDDDGTYMLRVRITSGELNSEQAKALAYIAYEFGHGVLDLTTRANVQIQGLSIDQVPRALERLEAVGLTCRQTGHDNVRNVYCHPFSGLDPEELIDTRQLAREVTALFIGRRDYADLPRKFNIALCGRPRPSLHYWTQDLAFLACHGPDSETMFQVLVAGKQGQTPALGLPLPVLVSPERVVEVTAALLDLFREQGPRESRDQSRFRVLVDELGVAGILGRLDERLRPLVPFPGLPATPVSNEDLVGWFPQRQAGHWIMGLSAPVGRLSWEQLEGVAVAAAKWGSGRLRTTVDQGLAIVDIPTGFKDAAATAVARYGLSPLADSIDRNVIACTGKQFCNIAVTETKSHALKLIAELRQRALALHGIRIHMSGCPSSCAQHHTAEIGLKGVRVRRLLGTREGFDILLAGGVNSRLHLGILYKLGVDVDQLPGVIEEVIREYYIHHLAGQTFSAYWRERLRDSEASAASEAEYRAAVWECDRCRRRHSGEDPPIYCPGCAGLRRHFARLELPAEATAAPSPVSASPKPAWESAASSEASST